MPDLSPNPTHSRLDHGHGPGRGPDAQRAVAASALADERGGAGPSATVVDDDPGLSIEFDEAVEPAAHADRRNAREKLAAGARGLKAAIRGDSSFFAHGYRGTLIVIAAALLGVNQWGWCLIVLGACVVLIAELAHSAVDTLARAIGDPDETRLKTAREIAAAGVLVAAFGSGAVTVMVLSGKLFELLGWRL